MLKDALTLSALIAAVLLVRAAFKNRVPKRMVFRRPTLLATLPTGM